MRPRGAQDARPSGPSSVPEGSEPEAVRKILRAGVAAAVGEDAARLGFTWDD